MPGFYMVKHQLVIISTDIFVLLLYSELFLYMTLSTDITDGRGLSNEASRELLPNKSKVLPC